MAQDWQATMFDRDRFTRCVLDFGIDSIEPVIFAQLTAAYRAPGRHYHTLAHIVDCLHEFDSLAGLANAPYEVEMAIWFHDAIYDPRAQNNEARSADWAADILRASSVNADVVERVHELIMATQHRTEPSTTDAAILVDVDLSILGQSTERFERYDALIRQEYAWVPEDVYCLARANVLEGFLARERIYHTEPCFARYEAQARINLLNKIRQLQ